MHQLIHDVIERKGREVEIIDPDDSVDAAVGRMNSRHIGSLLVIDDNRLLGILTQRDILVRVLGARRDPETTRVHEVMTRDLVVIGPQDSVADAMAVVTRSRCRHLPVVDGDKIVGVISAGDLTEWLVRDQRQTIDDLHGYITR